MVGILGRWQRPVASSVAMDLLHWVMRIVLHRRTRKVIKMARKVHAVLT